MSDQQNINDTFTGTKRVLPKQAYDMEYSTQTRKEFEFLQKNGIEPTFIKKTEFGVKTYKYTKTPALFNLLVEFYTKKQQGTEAASDRKVQIYA